MACKKCKKICKLCEHVIIQPVCLGLVEDQYTCKAHKKEEMDCVTGEMRTVYPLCSDMNKNGCCSKFKRDKEKYEKERLLKLLKNWKKDRYLISRGECIEEMLIKNLIRCLEHNSRETQDFWIDSEDGFDIIRSKYIEQKSKDD